MGLLLCVSGLSALPMSPVTRGSTPRTGWRVCLGLRRAGASGHRRRASTRPLQSPASVSLSGIFATSS